MDTKIQEDWWQAVLARDNRFDGAFVYGVRSTGIYCRPSCASRRPRQNQVIFFPLAMAAEEAGFRPCRRCRPQEAVIRDRRIEWVQRLCGSIEEHDYIDGPLTLAAMAKSMHLSPQHLQRTFKSVMGVTPRQYAEACRLRRLKSLVKNGTNVTQALYEAGYGSSSRLYEKALPRMGMTPGTYRKGGKAMHIRYTVVDCPLGRLLVAATEKGISAVSVGTSDQALTSALSGEYPAAEIRRDKTGLGDYVAALLKYLGGGKPRLDLPLDVQVTAFQWKVYEALRAIPYGDTRTYEEIARAVGRPKAVRAVGRACATNPAALVIPCHRVVRKDGSLGGYRWGAETKQVLLDNEKRTRAGRPKDRLETVPYTKRRPGRPDPSL